MICSQLGVSYFSSPKRDLLVTLLSQLVTPPLISTWVTDVFKLLQVSDL